MSLVDGPISVCSCIGTLNVLKQEQSCNDYDTLPEFDPFSEVGLEEVFPSNSRSASTFFNPRSI